MENVVIILIEDEIRITRFVQELAKLDIDASIYLPNTSIAVFELLDLNRLENKDQLFDVYYNMIEKGASMNHGQTQNCAFEILDTLKKWK